MTRTTPTMPATTTAEPPARASGFSIGVTVPRSNVGEVETAAEPSTVPTATKTGTGHHRREARRPSGISNNSALSGKASPGSHHQLSTHAAATPPGRAPGSATSASTAYAYARPPIVPHKAMIASTHEIGCSGLRVVSRTPIRPRTTFTPR